jgi:hypothetical protein
MIKQILEAIGLRRRTNSNNTLLGSLKPREFPGEVVSDGNRLHSHRFERIPWNRDRFGPEVTDFDRDHGGKIEFPMCTYKEFFRCSCGREIVRSSRALI